MDTMTAACKALPHLLTAIGELLGERGQVSAAMATRLAALEDLAISLLAEVENGPLLRSLFERAAPLGRPRIVAAFPVLAGQVAHIGNKECRGLVRDRDATPALLAAMHDRGLSLHSSETVLITEASHSPAWEAFAVEVMVRAHCFADYLSDPVSAAFAPGRPHLVARLLRLQVAAFPAEATRLLDEALRNGHFDRALRLHLAGAATPHGLRPSSPATVGLVYRINSHHGRLEILRQYRSLEEACKGPVAHRACSASFPFTARPLHDRE